MNVSLARITVCGPRRRLDLALPGHVPVAELLPELLRHNGDGLADDGERHGGWVLRRADGVPVSAGQALHQQGIRDGDVLHLVPGRTYWPEPEYDDVAEAIAAAARQQGRTWSAATTRGYALGAAGLWLGVGWLVLVGAGTATAERARAAALVGAAVLVVGVLAGRAWRDAAAGVVLGAGSLPYAFAAGLLAAGDGGPVGLRPDDWPTAAAMATGLLVLLGAAVTAGAAVAAGGPVFVAVATVAGLGSMAAVAASTVTGASGAAAGLLVVVGCGVGLLPRLAVRLGQVPTVVGTGDLVSRTVVRAERLLTGMLIGYAAVGVAASVVLVQVGGVVGVVLVGVVGLAMSLRSRTFVSTRQRLPLLVAGTAATTLCVFGVLPAYLPVSTPTLVVAGGVVAVSTAAAGARYAGRSPSPYLSRAADLLEITVLICVVPLAGAVFGLYRWAVGLPG